MIDYTLIAAAGTFYTGQGYRQVDAPWLVRREIVDLTTPPQCRVHETFDGCLVGSGEQSLLQMYLNGEIGQGRYQCVTPCFRDEPVVDEAHRPWFLKLELIQLLDPAARPAWVVHLIDQMLRDAQAFMGRYVLTSVKVVPAGDAPAYDIYSGDLELGSYGARRHGDLLWVYGTGVVEPRLSLAARRSL